MKRISPMMDVDGPRVGWEAVGGKLPAARLRRSATTWRVR